MAAAAEAMREASDICFASAAGQVLGLGVCCGKRMGNGTLPVLFSGRLGAAT